MTALVVTFQGDPDVQPCGAGVMFEACYGYNSCMKQEPG